MSEHCGSVADDGSAVCLPGACSCSAQAKENQTVQLSIKPKEGNHFWQKIRSGLMFAIACVASPCCTPLIVPMALALFAGSPAAIWATMHLGWVYGGLTLVSVVSLLLAFRWMNQKRSS